MILLSAKCPCYHSFMYSVQSGSFQKTDGRAEKSSRKNQYDLGERKRAYSAATECSILQS